MGRSYTPKYRAEMWDCRGMKTMMSWHLPVSLRSIEEYVWAYHNSMKSGGCNAHIPQSLGYVPTLNRVIIVRQSNDDVVQVWSAPSFMVI